MGCLLDPIEGCPRSSSLNLTLKHIKLTLTN